MSGGGATPHLAATPAAARGLCELVTAAPAHTLAVIGLVKNAGKTTVVNSLMSGCAHTFGLTSLGLDGERTDHLTGLAKPSIAPPPGTLVATTRGSLDRSRYDMEILEELPFHTSLGRVVVGRALGQGSVEVSGPTTLAELHLTAERLRAHGAAQVLVDGAINRLGSASPRVSDALVMATGGMVGDGLQDVLDTTVATLDMLLLPAAASATLAPVADAGLLGARAVCLDERGDATALDLPTVVGEGVTVAREVQRRRARTLYLAGALTAEFVDDFTRVLPPRYELRVVVRDATVLVLPAAALRRFRGRGIVLEVVTALHVLAVTANPFRVPQPYQPKLFFTAVADAVAGRVPVYDVVNGLAAAADTAAGARLADPAFP
jgi:hypothetical protein